MQRIFHFSRNLLVNSPSLEFLNKLKSKSNQNLASNFNENEDNSMHRSMSGSGISQVSLLVPEVISIFIEKKNLRFHTFTVIDEIDVQVFSLKGNMAESKTDTGVIAK